ncbi:MAG: hypothetical protein M1825_004606 [Sarcosagium campestre]|nr:MAG: hypothetical protein M1825_004606 [Sarcosagium campestre]
MKRTAEDVEQARDEPSRSPAFQVIILGSGGGPLEDNCTGFLVRSIATGWAKGSLLAVDAGSHLAAINRILEDSQTINDTSSRVAKLSVSGRKRSNTVSYPATRRGKAIEDPQRSSRQATIQSGLDPPTPTALSSVVRLGYSDHAPFAGLQLPFDSTYANAAYITRELVSTYLLTHPHLDHISAFVINTPSFQYTSRPKRLAALPATIDAIKAHIFNEVIWPNLSDEDGGVGLVSYTRLNEGGSMQMGEGEGRGYITICEGLGVKCFCCTHQTYKKKAVHRGSNAGLHQHDVPGASPLHMPPTPNAEASGYLPHHHHHHPLGMDRTVVVDSTAYFIRDESTGKELLIFGDVEPDSLSLFPRTAQVWDEAAPKLAAGILTGIFLECSYNDSQTDATLFGHLAPRHVIQELKALAQRVTQIRSLLAFDADLDAGEIVRRANKRYGRKRKRSSLQPGAKPAGIGNTSQTRRSPRRGASSPKQADDSSRERGQDSVATGAATAPAAATVVGTFFTAQMPFQNTPKATPATSPGPRLLDASWPEDRPPLAGLQVVIIHMKDTLRDGPALGDDILRQLQEYEVEANLGCTFVISRRGGSVWL